MFKGEGSFARKQLEKHGWREGAGLGSREHGIAEAIKVQLKHDTRGVGHNAATEFTDHWWDHAFNKAASSIDVQEGEDGVVVTRKKKSKKEQTADAKKTLYGNFIKGSLLSNGTERVVAREGTEEAGSDEEVEQKTHTLMLPEEELFQKCGSRTAHKGARHGLTANGKLARVERQEKELLEKLRQARAATPAPAQPCSGPASVGGGSQQSGDTSSPLQLESRTPDLVRSESEAKKSKKRRRDEASDGGMRCKGGRDEAAVGGDRTLDGELNPKKSKGENPAGGCHETPESVRAIDAESREGGSAHDGIDRKASPKKKKKKKSRKENVETNGGNAEEKDGEMTKVVKDDASEDKCAGDASGSRDDEQQRRSKKKSRKESSDDGKVGENSCSHDDGNHRGDNPEVKPKKRKKWAV